MSARKAAAFSIRMNSQTGTAKGGYSLEHGRCESASSRGEKVKRHRDAVPPPPSTSSAFKAVPPGRGCLWAFHGPGEGRGSECYYSQHGWGGNDRAQSRGRGRLSLISSQR